VVARMQLQVRDAGRLAVFVFEWQWLVDAAAFRTEFFEDSMWALPHVTDVFGHLAAMSRRRLHPTPEQVEVILEGCGIVPCQTHVEARDYIGSEPSAA